MNPTALVLCAVALGAIAGVALTLAITAARNAGKRRSAQMHPQLPEIAVRILDQIDTFAVILDASLSPVYVNPTARRERYITGEQLQDQLFLKRARAVLKTGVPDVRDPDPNDPSDTVRVRIARLQERFAVVLAEDLGEEQRVNAMRRDFIANVSHELKTPIAAIGLLADAVQEAADDPEMVRKFAKSLGKESHRLGELSRDIIHLSEAQSSLRPEDREPVHLRELVRGSVDSHAEYALQQGVDLVLTDHSDAALSDVILGRPSSLGAAIDNILSNAIRFSPRGGHVGVGIDIVKDRLSVTVTDQGAGIAPEHLPRIFERFYRVDGARQRDGNGGTGLGLSIARHSMRAHGGDIDVWSQLGVGSSFVLVFPLHENTRQEKIAKRARKAQRQLSKAQKQAAQQASASTPPDSAKTATAVSASTKEQV